VTHLLQQQETF